MQGGPRGATLWEAHSAGARPVCLAQVVTPGCDLCQAQGRTWQWGNAQQAAASTQDVIEITGYHEEAGNFVRLETPLTNSRPTVADLSREPQLPSWSMCRP